MIKNKEPKQNEGIW